MLFMMNIMSKVWNKSNLHKDLSCVNILNQTFVFTIQRFGTVSFSRKFVKSQKFGYFKYSKVWKFLKFQSFELQSYYLQRFEVLKTFKMSQEKHRYLVNSCFIM